MLSFASLIIRVTLISRYFFKLRNSRNERVQRNSSAGGFLMYTQILTTNFKAKYDNLWGELICESLSKCPFHFQIKNGFQRILRCLVADCNSSSSSFQSSRRWVNIRRWSGRVHYEEIWSQKWLVQNAPVQADHPGQRLSATRGHEQLLLWSVQLAVHSKPRIFGATVPILYKLFASAHFHEDCHTTVSVTPGQVQKTQVHIQ